MLIVLKNGACSDEKLVCDLNSYTCFNEIFEDVTYNYCNDFVFHIHTCLFVKD